MFKRDVQRGFWVLIREGAQTEDAAARVGVSATLGRWWFTQAGGMTPFELPAARVPDEAEDPDGLGPRGRYLSFREREEIALWRAQKVGVNEMGRRLGRPGGTISRELARNCQKGRPDRYLASRAQGKAEARAARPKTSKLADNQRLHGYVAAKLACRQRWSPEQIARRLEVDFPQDEAMRVSHEAIYQSLYVQGRGGLRRELTTCLRTGRALRRPRRRPDVRRTRIPEMVMISERPAEVADRAVPGHWEGDLIIGAHGGSAVGTLVERSTRFVMLLHLPRDHGAATVRDAIATTIMTLPAALRRSLTWDQGIELAAHAEITLATDLDIYFCDPHSPWQRGSNENTNGLLRQYLPKSTDLAKHSSHDLAEIADALNGRPRKTLGWRTPAEAMAALLSDPPVATTS
jgi:IS30 family transposase